MDYEKAYKDALERARKELKQDLHESGVWAIQRIFPELRESEDERIRKWLITSVKDNMADCWFDGDTITREMVLAWLDTLPNESEQPTKGYDEVYLNEKIAKASKSWEGVDVDKFMDEIRGREPVTDCNDLKKHTKEWVELMVGASFPEQDGDLISEEDYRSVIKQTARHFYELGRAAK